LCGSVTLYAIVNAQVGRRASRQAKDPS